jgi:vacuolar-type H+-ATPase subunit I/STV1
MKKTLLITLAVSTILLLASCGGPKSDVKKMLKLFEEYTKIAEKATEDNILDENEIKDLNKISNEIEEFSKEMDEKYENDTDAQKEMQDFMKEDDNKKIMNEYTDALMSLWTCEGAENLE